MFPNPASRARTQYFLNKDSSNKYTSETIGETSHSKVPDWKCGEEGGDVLFSAMSLRSAAEKTFKFWSAKRQQHMK